MMRAWLILKHAILGQCRRAITTTMEDQGVNHPVKVDSKPCLWAKCI